MTTKSEDAREAYERIAKELGHEADDPFDWCLFQYAWDAALASLPRMTEEELVELIANTDYNILEFPDAYPQRLDHSRKIARALINAGVVNVGEG